MYMPTTCIQRLGDQGIKVLPAIRDTIQYCQEKDSPEIDMNTTKNFRLKLKRNNIMTNCLQYGKKVLQNGFIVHSDCEFVAVPANMTHFFQPLDLTVNRSAKQFMQKQFMMYYSEIVRHKLEKGENIEDIEVDLRLTAIKPLHSQHV